MTMFSAPSSSASSAATTPAADTNEVYIRVARDEDAARISAVLEALGYSVLRQLDEGDGPARLRWAVTRLAETHKLTDREQDILESVLRGRNNEEIGGELSISRATVKWHMHNIFAKTNTGNREALLRLALQLGNGQRNSRRAATSPSAPVSSIARPMSAVGPKADGGHWSSPEEVTARIEFDQPCVPRAESIPSKRLF